MFFSLLSVEAVKAVDHYPRRLLIISPFPLVPGDCDLVEITVVQSPPTPHPTPQGITLLSPAPGCELIHRLLTVFKRSLNVLIGEMLQSF